MLTKNSRNFSKNKGKKIIEQLVIENCLAFGDNAKLTQKKVARYLLGTRSTFEIFKLYELRYLLLKIYPFIQNLFYNPRLNSTLKTQKIWNKNYKKQLALVRSNRQRKLRNLKHSPKWKPRVRIINSYIQKEKNLTPQVLFATITPMYTEIIKAAAQICNMPSHENRWLNGSITAAISYQEDHVRWNYITDDAQAQTVFHSAKRWGSNKENPEKTKEKLKYHGESRWPSLIIIPDLSNNIMIINEAKKVGLPIMGLVNSSTPFEIDYPIFAQEQTIQSIHFFCHFLATLIAKELVYIQHKRYILQKKNRKLKSKSALKETRKLWKLKRLEIRKQQGGKKIKKVKKILRDQWGNIVSSERMPTKNLEKRLRKKIIFFRLVLPMTKRRFIYRNWHTEYSALERKSRFFSRRVKFNPWHNSKKRGLPKGRYPLVVDRQSKNPIASWSRWINELKTNRSWARAKARASGPVGLKSRKTNFKLRKLDLKVIKVKRKGKKSLLVINKSIPRVRIGLSGLRLISSTGLKGTPLTNKRRSLQNQFFFKTKLTNLPLEKLRRFLKILGHYLKKKSKKDWIIKKQKYLSLILGTKKLVKLKKESSLKAKSKQMGIRRFLQQEAFKKRFSLRKQGFLSLRDQVSLWKKINQFLIFHKFLRITKKKKFLFYPRLRLHTHYKNYFAARLQQAKQITPFDNFRHNFRIVFKYRNYKMRRAERHYYYTHPAEWKAEKRRRYLLRLSRSSGKPGKPFKKKNEPDELKKMCHNQGVIILTV